MNDYGMQLVKRVTELSPEYGSEDIIKYITSNQERLVRYFQKYVPKHTASNNITIARALLGVNGYTIMPNDKYKQYRESAAMFVDYVMHAEGNVMEQFAYGAHLNDVIWLRGCKLFTLDRLEKKFEKGYPNRQVRDIYNVLITKCAIKNKYPNIIGDNICLASRAPVLSYTADGQLSMVCVDITVRSTATYEEIMSHIQLARDMADTRVNTTKSLKEYCTSGKLHYAQYVIGQGHVRISYDVDK